MNQSILVTVYFDYCCPFCFLGKLELERLEKELNLALDWRYYQIHREYPDTGIPIKEALGCDLEAASWQSIEYHLRQRNLRHVKKPKVISNTIKAQLVSEYAKSQGLFGEFQTAVYETYFHEGKGIGTEQEVLRIAEKIDLNVAEAKQAIRNLEYLKKCRDDDKQARDNGVWGIPTLMVRGRLALGAQSYDDMKYFIIRWGRQK